MINSLHLLLSLYGYLILPIYPLNAEITGPIQAGTVILGVIMLATLASAGVFIAKLINPRFFTELKPNISSIFRSIRRGKLIIDFNSFEKEINAAGYAYDEKQDIFYSVHDAWQRDYGYCRLYDELAGPVAGLVFDSEPVYFDYNGKRWLIEFWKGQYGMNYGGEIGIYNTTGPDISVPGLFNGTFFNSIQDGEMLQMAFILKKNGKLIMNREDTHWWLTGFKLGGFAEPSELSMDIWIRFEETDMLRAFLNGMFENGYTQRDIEIQSDNVVHFVFSKPKTTQPLSRQPAAEWLIQRKNEQMCSLYREVTEHQGTLPEKLDAVAQNAPDLYSSMTLIGKTRSIYKDEKKLRKGMKKMS